MNFARTIATRARLGRLAYRVVFQPIGFVRQSVREGGPLEQWRNSSGHEAMRRAASLLPPLAQPPAGPMAEIAFLSGLKYWHQTLFCFVSLQLQVPFRIIPVVHDDGSMNQETRNRLLRVVPWCRFVDATDCEQRLDENLPWVRFPSLRTRRLNYPHLRKLTDVHAASRQFRLVADSDMLFFRPPQEVIDWFVEPHTIYMQDCQTAYGYPLDYLSTLAGAPVPEPVNVGLYGIDGASIDWDQVEFWCRSQIETYGPHYVQEQALTAMLMAGRAAIPLPRETYVVMPDNSEGVNPRAILHHYVDVSKRTYFRSGWRRVAAMVPSGVLA